MTKFARLLVGDVVTEMRAIPHDHVRTVERLAVHPGIKAGLVRWPSGDDTIVDL
jgi:hypothetical protein